MTTKLHELKKAQASYMSKWKAEGKPFVSYRTPCCGKKSETTAPSNENEVWDSLVRCEHCGSMYAKSVSLTQGVTHVVTVQP